jgi:sugar transferase (PEP-CTERM/EpsH1 system associated)
MRILFIAHRVPYPANKGEKIRALWELRELCREHVVDLFCFCDDPEDKKLAGELRQFCNQLYVEDMSPLWSRARALAALVTGRPFSVAFFHSRTMAERIGAALRSASYDRIFVFSSSMAQYAEASAEIHRVLDLVDVDSDKWLQYAERSRWPWSWLWRREAATLGVYEASLVRDFTLTLVCTDAEAGLLRAKAPVGSIRVLENFVDVGQYDPGNWTAPAPIRAWQPYVVFSGSMDYRPNIDAALFFYQEIFPLVRRDLPQLRLVIAGRNPHPSIAALGSDPAVRITGGVTDMRPYIWGASAAIVPMRIARGVQNKILEALASGIPVVSTTAAAQALPLILRSLLRVADTPQAIAAAVIDLVTTGANKRPSELRAVFREYVQNLDLQSQLHGLVVDPESDHPETSRANREAGTGVPFPHPA